MKAVFKISAKSVNSFNVSLGDFPGLSEILRTWPEEAGPHSGTHSTSLQARSENLEAYFLMSQSNWGCPAYEKNLRKVSLDQNHQEVGRFQKWFHSEVWPCLAQDESCLALSTFTKHRLVLLQLASFQNTASKGRQGKNFSHIHLTEDEAKCQRGSGLCMLSSKS